MLHEVAKLLHYAGKPAGLWCVFRRSITLPLRHCCCCCLGIEMQNLEFIRVGTSGGLGVPVAQRP
jgi:hypothetical protein